MKPLFLTQAIKRIEGSECVGDMLGPCECTVCCAKMILHHFERLKERVQEAYNEFVY